MSYKRLILLSVFFYLLMGCNSGQNHKTQSSSPEIDEILLDFYHAESQQRAGRIISGNVVFRNLINLSEEANIFRPSTMAYTGDTVVFYDYSTNALIKVQEFKEITSMEVSGRGPGEFLNPVDIKIHHREVYIADSRLAKVSVFDNELNLQKDKMLDFLPHRLAAYDEGFLLMNNNFDGEGLFILMDSNGEVTRKFEAGISNPAAAFYVQGTIEYANSAFYYGSIGLGVLKKYDTRGELIWTRQTIEDYKLTPMHISVDGDGMSRVRMHPDRKYRISDMLVNGDLIYVLHSGELRRSAQFLDVYDAENGEYLETWETEQRLFSITVNEQGEMAALIYDDETEDFLLGYFELEND